MPSYKIRANLKKKYKLDQKEMRNGRWREGKEKQCL